MPFALIIVGIFLLTVAVRGTQDEATKLLKSDFTQTDKGPSFVYWVVAILLIGALGYIPKLKPLSTAFLGLVVVVLFLTKGNPKGIGGGFFDQFVKQIEASQTAPGASSSSGATSPVTGVAGAANSADWLKGLAPVIPSFPGQIQ